MSSSWKLGVALIAAAAIQVWAGNAIADEFDRQVFIGSRFIETSRTALRDLGVDWGGWTQVGYHNHNTPLSTVKNDRAAFNDHYGRLNLHQQYFWFEKELCNDGYGEWTLRSDILYGTDAQKTQSFGGTGWDAAPEWDRNGGYGWALPQLYVDIAHDNLSVKAGHFYTIVGYETVTAPDNFFYSHSLTMFNAEPFTHTGALATYSICPQMDIYAGWTAGWDTGFESTNDGSNFIGGVSYEFNEDARITYVTTAGNFGAIGDEGYSHSLVAELQLTDRVNYVFQSDLKRVNSVSRDIVGINQYLYYDWSENIDLGGRLEWFKRDGRSLYEGTAGANVQLTDNIIIRPEIRHDWMPYLSWTQTTFGMDAIVLYD